MSVLEATALSRHFGTRAALAHVDLRVDPGAVCALVGPNGSGKSTALRLAAGLLKPTAGTISIAGTQPGSPAARHVVSYVSDTPALYDDLSVIEHLELTAGLSGLAQWRRRAVRLAGHLGLVDHLDDLPGALSRGLRQRAALALGLLRPHDLLLVDEPVAGLDREGEGAVVDQFAAAAARGATIVVATHHPAVMAIATQIVALREGTVVFDGPSDAWPGF